MTKSPGAEILRQQARIMSTQAAELRAMGGEAFVRTDNERRASNIDYTVPHLLREARMLELHAAGVGQ